MKTHIDPVYNLPTSPDTCKVGVALVEVTMSNPNGDPDNGGAPRLISGPDGEIGLISTACIKRVIRDYAANGGAELFFARGGDRRDAQTAHDADPTKMTDAYWDLRLFGGVLTQANTRVRGPLQVGDALSVAPVDLVTLGGTSVTGVQREKPKKKPKKGEEADETPAETFTGATMHSYSVVRHGLYRFKFEYNPFDAKQIAGRGVAPADIALFYAGLIEGWAFNRSAHRTDVNLRSLYVFDTPAQRGAEPRHKTVGRIDVRATTVPSHRFEDYEIRVDDRNLPKGMTLSRWEDGVISAPLAAK
jgi:CRISPR-associated protein Csd2